MLGLEWATLEVAMPFNQQVVQQNIQSLQQRVSQLFLSPLSLESANYKEIKTNAPKDTSTEIQGGSKSSVDWWPMFRHDASRSGHSTSPFAPSTDNVLWTYETGGFVETSPSVCDDRLYVGSNDGYVYCLDAYTGEFIWNFQTGDFVQSSPAIYNGKVYIGGMCFFSKLYCLDGETGTHLWNYSTGWNIQSSPTVSDIQSSPTVSDGKVYFGSSDDKVYCIDAETGALLWNYTTNGIVSSSPAIYNDKVYVGSFDDNIYCLDANTGDFIWEFTTNDNVMSSPAIYNDKVYVGLDAETGALLWNYTTNSVVVSSPAVYNDKIYIRSHGIWQQCPSNVYCLDAETGYLIWNHTLFEHDWGRSSPAVADDKVYVGSGGLWVYCLDADSGYLIWNYRTSATVESSPAIVDGILYIGSCDDKVYAFKDLNYHPYPPNNPDPTDGAVDVPVDSVLSWMCDDPEADPITYDVYFEENNPYPETLVSGGQSGTTYDPPGRLLGFTTYYWRIVAWDDHGHSKNGPIWMFTTGEGQNDPPNKPSISGSNSGRPGYSYQYEFVSTDPDEDDIYYYIDWGDGNDSNWLGTYNSGEKLKLTYAWSEAGTYLVKAKAKDIYGAESDWATLEVAMPLNQYSICHESTSVLKSHIYNVLSIPIKLTNKELNISYIKR